MSDQRVRWFWLLGMAVCFALAHTQSPYVWSNQNQYYLHGAAAAGFRDLKNDWLANTRDPTPVFSWLVELAYRGPGPVALSVVYFGMLMLYFVTMDRLIVALFGPQRWHWLCMSLFLVIHSAALRVSSVKLFGTDYPWYLQAGVAGQYLLGPGLQPSVFGVWLLVGLANFAEGRPYRAAIWTALTTVATPTYLFAAAILVVSFQVALCATGSSKKAIRTGVMAFITVLPVIAYVGLNFTSIKPEFSRAAMSYLAEVRLPHHCSVEQWLDGIAMGQVALVIGTTFLIRRTSMSLVMGLAFAIGSAFTAVQWFSDCTLLALLFPWRVSAVMLPVATALATHWLCAKFARKGSGEVSVHPATISVVISLITTGSGIWISLADVGYHVNHGEDGVMNFVANHRQPGDVYIIPIRVPDLMSAPRGSVSLTFVKPKNDRHGIPLDFQRFRLATGAPIYIDFKSIPYADLEVIEWYRRIQFCQERYRNNDWEAAVERLIAENITHVIVPVTTPIESSRFARLYSDDHFRVYRIRTVE